MDPVDVGNPGFPGSGNELHFGSNASPGIRWNAEVTTPNGGAGEIAFTQRIKTLRRFTLNDGTKQKLTSGDEFILDDGLGIQYDGTTSIGSNDTKTHSRNDTPGNILTQNDMKTSADDNFELYLMYRPTGGIWVTLRKLEWHWKGSASKDVAGNWTLDSGSTSASVDPGSSDSTELPEWDNYFTNLELVNE
jgi:hypothetical protein